LGEGRKEARKILRNKKITLHHRADYFIENFIFHYFIEENRGCDREREKGEGTLLRPMEYVIRFFFYK
jgi:hypothetical protein